jgi:hypothetical protein
LKSALDQIWILLVNLPCRAESNNNDSNNFMDHSALSIIFLHWKLKIERSKREPFCLLVMNWLVPYIDHESSRFLPGSSSNMSKYNIGMCLPILSFPWRWFLFIILFFFLLFPEGCWMLLPPFHLIFFDAFMESTEFDRTENSHLVLETIKASREPTDTNYHPPSVIRDKHRKWRNFKSM